MKIQIENHGGRLRLRIPIDGRRKTMACGCYDDAVGRAYASQIKARMELDYLSGHFDPTLLKYRPRTLGRNASEITVNELFQRYTAHRLRDIRPGTLRAYEHLQGHLDRELAIAAHKLTERRCEAFRNGLSLQLSPSTIKGHLYRLSACWQWAKGKHHLSDDYWQGLAVMERVTKPMARPFTANELSAILEGFKTHSTYGVYYPALSFLVNTGCRFGEMAALRWINVSRDYKTATIQDSISRGSRKLATKTGKARTIILTPNLSMLLSEMHRPNDSGLVFPSPTGRPLDDKNFRSRAWQTVLRELGIEYRRPYMIRHTVASLALQNGCSPVDVAQQLGHSIRVLLDTYAHVIQSESVFQGF